MWFTGLQRCVECLLGCSFCDSGDITICYHCSTGYYMNSQKDCVGCPTGCKSCESESVCNQCESGYRLINGVCSVSCKHPCSDCLVGHPNNCTECYGGYALNAGTYACKEDLSCNDNSTCQFCPRKYFLDNGTCSTCNVPSTCEKCSSFDATVCTQCKVGYYLSAGNC